MLRQSFLFLPGVSAKKEKVIWQHAADWNSFLAAESIPGIAADTKHQFNSMIEELKSAVYDDNLGLLAKLFPSAEQWRLYQDFRDEAVFLDIETGPRGDVTVVGMSDGETTKTFVQGINLDRQALVDALKPYKLLVTFNGKSFDVPVLQKYFRIPFAMPHVDLKVVCGRLGYTGGLKVIEPQLGIKRPEELKHVTGQQAAELWRCWKATGDKDFFNMLIKYNEEDCINLKTIADRLVPQLWEQTRNGTRVSVELEAETLINKNESV